MCLLRDDKFDERPEMFETLEANNNRDEDAIAATTKVFSDSANTYDSDNAGMHPETMASRWSPSQDTK